MQEKAIHLSRISRLLLLGLAATVLALAVSLFAGTNAEAARKVNGGSFHYPNLSYSQQLCNQKRIAYNSSWSSTTKCYKVYKPNKGFANPYGYTFDIYYRY